VNYFCAFLARLHYPLKADRVVFRHRRAHNQDGVRVLQVLLRCGRSAPTI